MNLAGIWNVQWYLTGMRGIWYLKFFSECFAHLASFKSSWIDYFIYLYSELSVLLSILIYLNWMLSLLVEIWLEMEILLCEV